MSFPLHLFPEGLTLELLSQSEGSAELALDLRASHVNPVGVVHGGAVFALLDSAAGFVVSRLCGPGETCVSVSSSTSHVAPLRPEDERLVGRATVTHRGRTVVHVSGEARSGAGKLVAQSISVFYVRGARA